MASGKIGRFFLPVLLVLVLGAAAIVAWWPAAEPPPLGRIAATIGGERFVLELAVTPAQRYQGLSDRPAVPPRTGMLFIFPRSMRLSFVMRRCLVPLDLIYLDTSGRIVSMHTMTVEPADTPRDMEELYDSVWPALYAIELPGGTLAALPVKVGDTVELPMMDLKGMAR